MFMKVLIWLGKKLATVALTVVVTLWLTGLMMTSVIQSVLKEYEIPLTVEPAIYAGILDKLWGYTYNNEEELLAEHDELAKNEVPSPISIDESESEGIVNEPSVEVLAPIEMNEEIQVTEEELGVVKDELSDAEKEKLLALIVDKIPIDEWQQVSQYLEDGLSDSEILEVQQVLAKHLSEQEYSELLGILKKY